MKCVPALRKNSRIGLSEEEINTAIVSEAIYITASLDLTIKAPRLPKVPGSNAGYSGGKIRD